MGTVVYLNDRRSVPSVQQQMDRRELWIRTRVMEIYQHERALVVAMACHAAAQAVNAGLSMDEALEAAEEVIDEAAIGRFLPVDDGTLGPRK